ncbi:MAG: FecR domain-containing protein [Polaromonas sp.]|nr:FecR domain-containing protein [Polaromonas sp.]
MSALWSMCFVVRIFAGSTPAWAQSANGDDKAGIVKMVSGDVRVRNGQGERALQPGDTVKTSDRLITGKQSSGSVVLRDGTTLVLTENSQLVLDKFAFNATTQDGNILINLLQGSMRMLTGLIAKVNPAAIQIKTKTVSVGIRGTDFIVETEEKAE